ncbi:MAG: alpha-galactosidase [Microbacterium sp.]
MFTHSGRHPVILSGYGLGGGPALRTVTSQPLVELMLAGDGRARTTTRFTNTAAGARLRYLRHVADREGDAQRLRICQRDSVSGAVVETTLLAGADHHGIRVFSEVRNGSDAPVVIEAVTSFAIGALVRHGEDTRQLTLYAGTGEQLAENRWSAEPLWGQCTLGEFDSAAHLQPGRGAVERIGTSTWTTARELPTGVLANEASGSAFAWQVEHNGGWRWEIVDVRDGEDSVGLLLLGPEDVDHQWACRLTPGESFTTVPASFVFAHGGFEAAVAELTRHRRWLRRGQRADPHSILVFNDYMNTLNGDPTTERLLPLISAAGRVGAECFCIDAGWYDDSGAHDWWPTVGEWRPSVQRFPDGGLARVVQTIRDAGMKVGLWLEPEVVGVHSPIAELLPDEAFLRRHGVRIREHDRHFLDLRHPAARAHLDAAFDALVAEFAVDYFKLDYNVTPGTGVDGAFSGGEGMLAHNRAHVEWFRALRDRHPAVIFENCASGAMRADFAMLEVFDVQSTSDQVDHVHYAPIAAGAPLQILPEQSANWAYPQPWMSDEAIAFTLVNGLAGRLYLSGFIDGMSESQCALVRDAVSLYQGMRAEIARSVPRWPAGLAQWYGEAIALRLTSPRQDLLYVWHRGEAGAQLRVALGLDVLARDLDEVFPRVLRAWVVRDESQGVVVLEPCTAEPSARVYSIRSRETRR